MAETPEAVADTHALLFHAAGDHRLGKRAARIFGDAELGQAIVHVPLGVVWEVCVLVRAGRAVIDRSAREFFGDLFSNPAYQAATLSLEEIYAASELGFAPDPFDALIVSSARTLGLPLLTRDTTITESGLVRAIW